MAQKGIQDHTSPNIPTDQASTAAPIASLRRVKPTPHVKGD